MAETKLTYCFTPSAAGNKKKGIFCVECRFVGKSLPRPSMPIKGLANPSLDLWDRKARRFVGRLSKTDVENNEVLDGLALKCDELMANPRITTPAEFIEALKTGTAPEPVETYGEFLRGLIRDMKKAAGSRKPSKNHQIYTTLLHKLEREGEIVNVPVGEISDRHFRQFARYLLSLSAAEGLYSYATMCCRFKAVWKRAYELEKNDNTSRFRYSELAPRREEKDGKVIDALTPEQYRQFVCHDLSAVRRGNNDPAGLKELYRDFCIFLYESVSRPADVVKAHSSQIREIQGRMCFCYVPEKKKNDSGNKKYVRVPLSETALSIVGKYRGRSSQGYIFPFSMNDYKWDFNDAASWDKWNNRKNRTLEKIRKFLGHMEQALGLDFHMDIYTFRHSAISHLVNSRKYNSLYIANIAGTSVSMIEEHYYDHTLLFDAV